MNLRIFSVSQAILVTTLCLAFANLPFQYFQPVPSLEEGLSTAMLQIATGLGILFSVRLISK